MTEPLDAKPYLFVQKNFRTALSRSQFRPIATTQDLRTPDCSCPFLNPDLSGIHRALATVSSSAQVGLNGVEKSDLDTSNIYPTGDFVDSMEERVKPNFIPHVPGHLMGKALSFTQVFEI